MCSTMCCHVFQGESSESKITSFLHLVAGYCSVVFYLLPHLFIHILLKIVILSCIQIIIQISSTCVGFYGYSKFLFFGEDYIFWVSDHDVSPLLWKLLRGGCCDDNKTVDDRSSLFHFFIHFVAILLYGTLKMLPAVK